MSYFLDLSGEDNLTLRRRSEDSEEELPNDSDSERSIDSIGQGYSRSRAILPQDYSYDQEEELSERERSRQLDDYYSLHPIPTLEQYYSEEARSQPTLTFEEYRRTIDYQRDTAIDFERQNIQELLAGQENFIGISPAHPVPERIRYQQEYQYESHVEANRIRHNSNTREPAISTTITLSAYGYPTFEFTDGFTGRRIRSAFPSARDVRLDWHTRIILQALEVSFQDPDPSFWEEFYDNN